MALSSSNLRHPSIVVQQELDSRNWTWEQLAEAIGGNARLVSYELKIWRDEQPTCVGLGKDLCDGIGRALGTSSHLWRILDDHWRKTNERTAHEGKNGPLVLNASMMVRDG